MARGVRLTAGRLRSAGSGRGWLVMSAVVGVLAVLAWPVPREWIDWQPGLFAREPWRAVTAPFVHLSALHLGANLAGVLLVGLLGRVADVGAASVVAWLVAWPVTQAALFVQPELSHYAGLSGVLHAGVAVVAVHLLVVGPRTSRWIALGLLIGLVAKIVVEAPWQGALRHPTGWDIAVAPLAHAAGAMAGAVSSLAAEIIWRRNKAPN